MNSCQAKMVALLRAAEKAQPFGGANLKIEEIVEEKGGRVRLLYCVDRMPCEAEIGPDGRVAPGHAVRRALTREDCVVGLPVIAHMRRRRRRGVVVAVLDAGAWAPAKVELGGEERMVGEKVSGPRPWASAIVWCRRVLRRVHIDWLTAAESSQERRVGFGRGE